MDGDGIIITDVNAVRLHQAVLCANCDTISDSPHDSCLICGSRSLLPLSRVLGEIRSSPLPVEREATVHQPSVVPDMVLVLTSPLPHRPRRRRRVSRG